MALSTNIPKIADKKNQQMLVKGKSTLCNYLFWLITVYSTYLLIINGCINQSSVKYTFKIFF